MSNTTHIPSLHDSEGTLCNMDYSCSVVSANTARDTIKFCQTCYRFICNARFFRTWHKPKKGNNFHWNSSTAWHAPCILSGHLGCCIQQCYNNAIQRRKIQHPPILQKQIYLHAYTKIWCPYAASTFANQCCHIKTDWAGLDRSHAQNGLCRR